MYEAYILIEQMGSRIDSGGGGNQRIIFNPAMEVSLSRLTTASR